MRKALEIDTALAFARYKVAAVGQAAEADAALTITNPFAIVYGPTRLAGITMTSPGLRTIRLTSPGLLGVTLETGHE